MPTTSPAMHPWRSGARDETLDMVKGLLVVGMLVIHAGNLSIDTPENRNLVYPALLGFVSGSWLLISGYIIGMRYRVMFWSDPRGVSWRLFGRGWRLVAIFILSNLVLGNLSLAACTDPTAAGSCDLVRIFIEGDDTQAFEVLLGIGYTLVVAPLCLLVPVQVMAAATLVVLAALSVPRIMGMEMPMLVWMMSCGISGIVIGSLVATPVLHRIVGNRAAHGLTTLLAVLVWGGTDMLFIFGYAHHDTPGLYVAHVTAMLWLLYGTGLWIQTIDWLNRPLTLLAHYSLLAYMGQMAILRTWQWLVPGSPVLGSFPVSVFVGLLALLLSLTLLSALRARYRWVDRAYLSVFG